MSIIPYMYNSMKNYMLYKSICLERHFSFSKDIKRYAL